MAVILDLPPELIDHILSLAYLTQPQPPTPCEYIHSKRGLRAAALVHPAWTALAQALLTHDLHLTDSHHGSYCAPCVERENGTRLADLLPRGFNCRRVEAHCRESAGVVEVLGRARQGCVRELEVGSSGGALPADFFGLPALSCESGAFLVRSVLGLEGLIAPGGWAGRPGVAYAHRPGGSART